MDICSTEQERESLLNPRQVNRYIPTDRYYIVYIIFTFLGVACLLPWNFFITAQDYFQFKLRNTSVPEQEYNQLDVQTDQQRLFESYLSIVAMVTNLVFMLLTTAFIRIISINVRMVISLIIITLVFGETTALVLVNSDQWQGTFFIVTLTSAAVIMASVAVATGSFIGLSCLFPVKYTQACMIGQAIGGTFSALAKIFSVMGKGSVKYSAFAYFMTASVVSLLSLVAYWFLLRMKFSKFYLSNQIDAVKNVNNEIPSYVEIVGNREYFTNILKKTWPLTICSFLTFMVTLSCFPSICSAIRPIHNSKGSEWTEKYFTPVVCFLMFNVGDCLGRLLTSWFRRPSPRHKYILMFASFLRVIYIPLLMFCNTQSKHFNVVFNHDAYPIVFILTLGMSNGYLSTLSIMFAPMQVPIEQAEGAGLIMALALTIGLSVGSLFSLLFMQIIN